MVSILGPEFRPQSEVLCGSVATRVILKLALRRRLIALCRDFVPDDVAGHAGEHDEHQERANRLLLCRFIRLRHEIEGDDSGYSYKTADEAAAIESKILHHVSSALTGFRLCINRCAEPHSTARDSCF